MKTLKVYVGPSFFTYEKLYEVYFYEVDSSNCIRVLKKDFITGLEIEEAVFRNWDYYMIEDVWEEE